MAQAKSLVSKGHGSTHVLALNAGSSSLKFGVYLVTSSECVALVSGAAESLGSPDGTFQAKDAGGRNIVSETGTTPDVETVLVRIRALLATLDLSSPSAIGHRVVHGGPSLREHCLIDDAVMETLEGAAGFAPVHSKATLTLIRAARGEFAGVPQIACFDTAFHSTLPDVARVLPLPRELQAEGIQRYGFHGLSCESIVRQLGKALPSRAVIAHLGHGASITAVKDGRSIDTTMGLTPTGGLVMSTRSGDLDPGVLLHLMTAKSLSPEATEDLVDRRSGMLGVSGLSGDMRVLKSAALSNASARLAIDMFYTSVAKHLAAMAVALGGVDLIVFTGGIGEHDPEARVSICSRLSWLRVAIDEGRNLSVANPIHAGTSRCAIRVLPPKEDEQIALHTASLTRPH